MSYYSTPCQFICFCNTNNTVIVPSFSFLCVKMFDSSQGSTDSWFMYSLVGLEMLES